MAPATAPGPLGHQREQQARVGVRVGRDDRARVERVGDRPEQLDQGLDVGGCLGHGRTFRRQTLHTG